MLVLMKNEKLREDRMQQRVRGEHSELDPVMNQSLFVDSSLCPSIFRDKDAPLLPVWGACLTRGFYDLFKGKIIRSFLHMPSFKFL